MLAEQVSLSCGHSLSLTFQTFSCWYWSSRICIPTFPWRDLATKQGLSGAGRRPQEGDLLTWTSEWTSRAQGRTGQERAAAKLGDKSEKSLNTEVPHTWHGEDRRPRVSERWKHHSESHPWIHGEVRAWKPSPICLEVLPSYPHTPLTWISHPLQGLAQKSLLKGACSTVVITQRPLMTSVSDEGDVGSETSPGGSGCTAWGWGLSSRTRMGTDLPWPPRRPFSTSPEQQPLNCASDSLSAPLGNCYGWHMWVHVCLTGEGLL